MKKLIAAIIIGCITSTSYGLMLNKPEVDTTMMLVAHTKYIYKNNIKPGDEPNDLVKAMRVCIVTQMTEPGCHEILENRVLQVIINE
jgi:hypothetical protein